MRLIDADKLKEDINSRFLRDSEKRLLCRQIDKAPTVFNALIVNDEIERPLSLIDKLRALDLIESLYYCSTINNKERGVLRRAILLKDKETNNNG